MLNILFGFLSFDISHGQVHFAFDTLRALQGCSRISFKGIHGFKLEYGFYIRVCIASCFLAGGGFLLTHLDGVARDTSGSAFGLIT